MSHLKRFNIYIPDESAGIHAYEIFKELAKLLQLSLSELGYHATITHHFYQVDFQHILLGAHLLDASLINSIPKGSIIFNTEQLSYQIEQQNNISSWQQRIIELGQRFTIWDYSQFNINVLNRHGIAAKHLVLGYLTGLKRIIPAENQDIDVLFYGSINDRRAKILEDLRAEGLKVEVLFGVYGRERDAYIARSKVVLNLHYYDTENFEIVRCSYLMNNAVTVLAEVNETTFIDSRYLPGLVAVPYQKLVTTCLDLVANPGLRWQMQTNALATLAAIPQSQQLDKLIDQL